jgi:hypothetical protein
LTGLRGNSHDRPVTRTIPTRGRATSPTGLGFAAALALGCGTTSSPGVQQTGTTADSTTSAAGTSTTAVTTDADSTAAATSPSTTGPESTGDPTGVTPEPDDCITDVAAGHHAFECDGIVYDVEVPAACLEAPCGMIFDVHGFTMSAQMQDANTGMRALGQANDFIVVQPNANPAPPAASWTPAVDDDKIFGFMQRVAAAWDVDPDRWHFTGFSQGGFMSWRFICAHADVLASVAPAAACGDGVAFPDCRFIDAEVPSEPIDILYLHGTTDALVGYGCAEPRVDAIVEHFGLGAAEVLAQDDTSRHLRYSGDEMVLEFLAHDYSAASVIIRGHCYPGSTDPGDAPGQLFSFACEGDSALVWGETAMAFFRDHPR